MKSFAELVAEQIAADRADFERMTREEPEKADVFKAMVNLAQLTTKQKAAEEREAKLKALVEEAADIQRAAEYSGLLDD